MMNTARINISVLSCVERRPFRLFACIYETLRSGTKLSITNDIRTRMVVFYRQTVLRRYRDAARANRVKVLTLSRGCDVTTWQSP
jgi:hypothetical protein